MDNVFKLINNRLGILDQLIKQHKYCIQENIYADWYKSQLITVEREYKELKKEYEELIQYCIKRNP